MFFNATVVLSANRWSQKSFSDTVCHRIYELLHVALEHFTVRIMSYVFNNIIYVSYIHGKFYNIFFCINCTAELRALLTSNYRCKWCARFQLGKIYVATRSSLVIGCTVNKKTFVFIILQLNLCFTSRRGIYCSYRSNEAQALLRFSLLFNWWK